MNQDVADQLTRARTGLILDFPFFGQLVMRLKFVEDSSIKTLAVDGKRIFYNPDFVNNLSVNLKKSALAHEVGHCIYEHIGRRGARNPKKWNYAGDYVINAMLKDAGFEIGDGWLYNPVYAGMSSDEIYNALPDDLDDSGKEPLDEILDGTPETVEIDATDWKIATIQAAQAAKAVGKLPASMERFIDEMTATKVDWRAVLRRFVTERSKDDYSWMRPNRNFASLGMFLPGLYSESIGEVVVAIDTSGSIDQHTLNVFGSEVSAVSASVRPAKLTVIYCDAKINHVDVFGPNDVLRFDMHGGGGTDFCPPFDYVSENDIKPACFIYLTDMYGRFPAPPGYPVLWCATSSVVGPFGETIEIEV